MSAANRAILMLALVATACSPQRATDDPDGTWVGTITIEGNVTTVVNESGSVWGGAALLVEEASIGVDAGSDEYMLGQVRGVAASPERIYLVDSQVPALRTYDRDGVHIVDFGREGEGPGEFRRPLTIGVDAAGKSWLHDRRGVILVFSPEGETLATVAVEGRRVTGPATMVVTPEGIAFVFDAIFPEAAGADSTEVRLGMSPYDLEGRAGEMIDFPTFGEPAYLTAEGSGSMRFVGVPFHPNAVTVFAPSRAVLGGDGSTYRFEIARPDGARMVVQLTVDPVAVDADEAAAHRRGAAAYLRAIQSDWVWNETDIPATKPAYYRIVPTVSGEIWVVRGGPGAPVSGCDEDSFEPDADNTAPCWVERRIVDVFDAEGLYLGEAVVPDEFRFDPLPFINGNDIVARAEDEAGTIMVKRYRLVLPGEEER